MRIIRHPKKKSLKGCVVALGTFDGVHRGHRQILRQAVKHARKIRAAAIAITFDPHPQQVIVPERGLKLLTTLKEREELFCQHGMDGVIVVRFSKHTQKLTYEQFIERYLVDRLGVRHVVIGYDYAFGRGRSGNAAELQRLGKKHGFSVSIVPAVRVGRQPIKSRYIRELISAGEFNQALSLLGHPYQLNGRVVRGSGRGRQLGFPTANLKLAGNKLIPAHGVYAGRLNKRKCVVNIGARPTFGPDQTVIEVHLFNFQGSLRGRRLSVELTRRLRPEKQFSDVEKLKEQIKRDIIRVKQL
ncbi:MAG: bifunctional riboflavin kinase/FAD synthetase [Candidatus Saganbacteria bacterium]|nr:bifunctional riboflavin kinase/FAD synthetase [Candidatus Saganbacteria bacterium]